MTDLPSVPASPLPQPPAGQAPQVRTIIQPVTKVTPPAAQVGTVFDQAPPATAAARQRASGLRTALATSLRQLLTAKQSAEATLGEIKDDNGLTDALSAEGIPPAKLAAFLKAAKPLLDAFTTQPPAMQAGGQAPPPAPSA